MTNLVLVKEIPISRLQSASERSQVPFFHENNKIGGV